VGFHIQGIDMLVVGGLVAEVVVDMDKLAVVEVAEVVGEFQSRWVM